MIHRGTELELYRRVNVIVIVELNWISHAANIVQKIIFGLPSNKLVYKINQSKYYTVLADENGDISVYDHGSLQN